ncbi:L-serine ammonia-lyase, iron-sulfur-dependent subunit beta [Tissierella creatinophila]|uniref:L-serine deaminase n=1 Tax=Tissierella creatinophila DSM 6911 TaxID=1123403 RepID=A0A1U7M6S0_TISCR|nr:L-serine ammonia-lyase, iron-sulfur-dependent subunit beta [Tissierella creatinophila]OLS02975.1 L-serine dehydratase, beta chain [Tissierella creatinophila DSM 6911]
MKDYSVFDILGPIMIGPSSSHTAGAARLARISKEIAGDGFYKVAFMLHGSFAKTYKGHGTDKALVGGILGMDPDDENIKTSLEKAEEKNIDISFEEVDLGYVHPNTVKLIFKYRDKEDFYIIGSSIGGGNIVIVNINGNDVNFTADKPTLFLKYKDRKGVISEVGSIFSTNDFNIASMKVTREKRIATMICELDSTIDDKSIESIKNLKDILYIKSINPIVR